MEAGSWEIRFFNPAAEYGCTGTVDSGTGIGRESVLLAEEEDSGASAYPSSGTQAVSTRPSPARAANNFENRFMARAYRQRPASARSREPILVRHRNPSEHGYAENEEVLCTGPPRCWLEA